MGENRFGPNSFAEKRKNENELKREENRIIGKGDKEIGKIKISGEYYPEEIDEDKRIIKGDKRKIDKYTTKFVPLEHITEDEHPIDDLEDEIKEEEEEKSEEIVDEEEEVTEELRKKFGKNIKANAELNAIQGNAGFYQPSKDVAHAGPNAYEWYRKDKKRSDKVNIKETAGIEKTKKFFQKEIRKDDDNENGKTQRSIKSRLSA